MTFSLVGRCAWTGMLGAAVATSSMAVGSRCPHVRAGVGAALTQHRTDPRLGPLGLELLSRGFSPDEANERRWRPRLPVTSCRWLAGRACRAGSGAPVHFRPRTSAAPAVLTGALRIIE